MAQCPNCDNDLESYANCGRCSPPCDNVIAHRCGICGLRATTYNGHWSPVTMEHVTNKGSFETMAEIALRGFRAYTTSLGVDPGREEDFDDYREWESEHAAIRDAWIAATKAIISG
jgi:hypothetical protein